MMITKAQVELVKAHLWPRDDTTEWQSPELHDALSALIAVGERLADQTHGLIQLPKGYGYMLVKLNEGVTFDLNMVEVAAK